MNDRTHQAGQGAPVLRADHIGTHAGYDTRHEHAELLLLGGALLTIVAVVLVSVSTLLG
jgi:hypothetical protein